MFLYGMQMMSGGLESAAGNKMKYFLDEKLVDVTDNNVWDIEEIPSFRFEVKNKGIKTASGEDGDTLDNKILDESYTMSEVKIVGEGHAVRCFRYEEVQGE